MEEIRQPVKNRRRKIIALIVFTAVAVLGIITVYFYLQYKSTHITTDDAFVEGHIYTIASKINGTVKTVYVKDNQPVKKGELLLEIDPVDYDVKVKEARASFEKELSRLSEIQNMVDTNRRQVAEIIANLEASRANLELHEVNLRQAEKDINRAENLFKKEALSKERYEKAKTAYDVAVAHVKAAKEHVKELEASLETQKAMIKQTESALPSQKAEIGQKHAALKIAELNRDYTRIYAPSDGYVTKKSVEIGNQIRSEQPLIAIVPLDDIWVTANYKETQLEKVRPGQRVRIKVDTYPGKVFWGKVDSIMAGTGAVFSLFPPENATGTYVKVVQRIPVKILVDKGTDPKHVLRIGMSVASTIFIEK
jgi:membrane fusion protein (multidrug efflux system)